MSAKKPRPATKAPSVSKKLTTYRAKRNPQKTTEPMGSSVRAARNGRPTFVVQEHHARALHWDFRLERDGVLVSWALPKGLPDDPHANHLAVHTEDHPLDYGDFEGDIPKGEYGAGHVTVWDHGTYETEKWRDDEIMVILDGRRVSGRFVLFPTDGKNWMIHRMDAPAPNFEEMPRHLKPMLATSGELASLGRGWSYEFKWDGVRALVYVEGGRVQAFTRNDKGLVATFPELREIGLFLGSRSAVLDGEIVVLDEDGRPDFAQLSHRLHLSSKSAIDRLAKTSPASFFAFDVLYLDGTSLLDATYDERREKLEALKLEGTSFATPPASPDGNGAKLLAIARDRGLEGVVAKRRDSLYAPGRRNGDWIKVKNFRTQEVVIGGWTRGQGEREGSLGALLVGVYTSRGLEYVGKVGTGFSAGARTELLRTLAPLARASSPFLFSLSAREAKVANFVRPTLVGEVRFGEWTDDGRLRHPSWRGLRADKKARDVRREP
ncbi:MAG TPA: non-homologous end-joining DNA ligase [Acidimicrobiales bacterium]|jgi:bifunctional non-homologous end joining protein LigD|nr:non-homologous end-joining DNA ligase [Acidimicrobiales bacterium]